MAIDSPTCMPDPLSRYGLHTGTVDLRVSGPLDGQTGGELGTPRHSPRLPLSTLTPAPPPFVRCDPHNQPPLCVRSYAPCRCSFPYPFACSFVHMAVHLFIHPLTRSLVGPFIRLTARLPPCSPDFCSPTCQVIQPLFAHSSVCPHLRFVFCLAACPTSCLSIHAPTCPPALFPSCWPAHLGNSFEVAERLCP